MFLRKEYLNRCQNEASLATIPEYNSIGEKIKDFEEKVKKKGCKT